MNRDLKSWHLVINDFEKSQLESGLSPATVYSRVNRLNRLAEYCAVEPDSLTMESIRNWIDAIPTLDKSPATLKAQRLAIRAFASWALASEHQHVNIGTFKSPSTYNLTSQWSDALDLFKVAMRATGNTSSTSALRLKHLTRFANDISISPWKVSYEEIRGWLDSLECSRATMLAHRVSIRAFYRWAFRTGRVFQDPSDEPCQRAKKLELPANWEPELSAFRSYLRASGKPETTVSSRIGQLSIFARENASLEPWQVCLDDLVEWMSGKRWATETRRGHRSALRAFYSWAVDTGRIDVSPASKLPVSKASSPRPRPALDTEYYSALQQASEREQLALRLAAELGLRRAEVAAIHTRDLLETQGNWSLVVHGKGSKERLIPLPKGLHAALNSRPDGFIFPGQYNGHLSPRYLGKLISGLLPKGVTMHALRHRFATRAYNIDRDVFTVQQLLGHASPETTQRYVQVSDLSMRRLVEAVQ